ncbi:MAG: tetraacyldisaccharide 4'-kinase [Bacteroidetes bacterium]|nr:MAG: tetraacyldisaccharide 4'-kinase [Bacteroidota bacterium]
MNFNYLEKGIRILLLPISALVGIYISLRNFFYNRGWLSSTPFNFPLVAVGNLSVGGTGKSPMVEYLLRLLLPQYQVGTISRGYKRKTKGYLLANPDTTALEIGDEPMQFYRKFPNVGVAVGEQRLEAIPQLLHDLPQTDVIVLDDAFQHRAITAGLNILLTDYSNPFWHDWYLPTGELRDNRHSAKRAQIIVVTKCPPHLTQQQKMEMLRQMAPNGSQHVFFTAIAYGVPYHLITKQCFELHQNLELLLVCGIANPQPLKAYLELKTASYIEKTFRDHHIFTIDDWNEIDARFRTLGGKDSIILTTEKDAVRLLKFADLLQHLPVYVLPIEHQFLFNEGPDFDAAVLNFINNFANNSTMGKTLPISN